MSIEQYSPCLCGSGKKFKWCCQPLIPIVEKAFSLHERGQHEAALRTLQEGFRPHTSNPQAWAYQAQFLISIGRLDEADQALDQAFAIDPNHPFALMLRGMLREQEREPVGALLLFRKAAESYDPQAHEQLAELYAHIARTEFTLNKPIATRYALERAIEHSPTQDELRQNYQQLFEQPGRLPDVARRGYTLRQPRAALTTDAATAWEQALAQSSKLAPLGQQRSAFEFLTSRYPEDAAAWYNLGLIWAWLGEHPQALDAFHRSVELDGEEATAAETVAMCEVLRCGRGMEQQSDYRDLRVVFRMRDWEGLTQLIQEWSQSERVLLTQANREMPLVEGLILESPSELVLTGSKPPMRLGAYFLAIRDVLSLTHPRQDMVDRITQEVQDKIGMSLTDPHREIGPIRFHDVVIEAVIFPTANTSPLEAELQAKQVSENYFETVWYHRPLKSLAGLSPRDQSANPGARSKLRGLVQFLEDCYALTLRNPETGEMQANGYNFDRLRTKLGLSSTVEVPSGAKQPISEFGPDELAALSSEELSEQELEEAFQRSLRLDDRAQADRFAEVLIARPVSAEHSERYRYFSHLMQSAQQNGDLDRVEALIEAGEKVDQLHQQSKHALDYSIRRGQLLAKRGAAEQAYSSFQATLASDPEDLRHYGTASETMLSLRNGNGALAFAEQGLAAARQQNNRDSEGYFLELIEAAKRQMG